jgi:hypothetical protein
MRRLGASEVGGRRAASRSIFAARDAAAARLVTGTQRVGEPDGVSPNAASPDGPDQPY